MYYPHSIKIIQDKIGNLQKETMGSEQQKDVPHILWMLGEIRKMNSDQSAKAGRWIGWILRDLEVLKIITNEESRDMIRIDVMNDND